MNTTNWTTPTIVKASEVVVGDRVKRQARIGNLVKAGQYLQVVSVVADSKVFHIGDSGQTKTVEGVKITFRDMKTNAKKTEFQSNDFVMGVYR